MDVMARRRAIMAHIARLVKKIISSVTGLVSFVTNVEEPTKVICTFSPVQSGTGDPSPDNVRPISGWDGCEITKSNIAVDEATKEYVFSEIQEGSGDPSATNYRPIIPGLSITRDDNSALNVYGGKLKVNADGTSVLTATRGILTWDSSRSPYALSGRPRTAVVWGSSTYLWGNGTHRCDRAQWGGYGIGSFARAGSSWTFGSPTQEIYDIEDDTEWLAAMKTWLDENPITICSILYHPVTYNLTATETDRAMDALGITQQTVLINWKLPDEYQEVEFITANGNQYFWSDVLIQDGLTVDAKQSFNGGDSYLFGGHADNTGNNRCAYNGHYASRVQSAYPEYFLAGSISSDGTVFHVITTFKDGHRTIYIDGVNVLDDSRGTATQETGKYCTVFGQRSKGDDMPGTVSNTYRGSLYSLKVSKNGTMLADYIPCYRKADIKPGMYDLVTGTFYVNQGTGDDFTVGPDASTLPGTVYGGTVTLNEDGSADLTVSWGSKDLGSINWKQSSSSNCFYAQSDTVPYKKNVYDVGRIICTCLKNGGGRSSAPWYGADGTFQYYAGGVSVREIYVKDERYSRAEEFKAGVAGELFVYEIDDPQTYHFDSIGQLQSFLGTNNIWHSMNDDITVEYYNYQ